MTVCFDVETAWQEAFRYGWLTDYESAWEDVAALKPRITGATAYIIDLNEWRSFRPEEISGLCSLVASASRVVTFNGKRWDIPVIGRHSPSKAVTAKLRLLIEERAENHDDLCQIAPGKLLDLYLLNFDRKLADGWSQSAEDYKSRLIDAGWEIHPAYKASQAYSDTGKTHELWTRWRKGSLQRG